MSAGPTPGPVVEGAAFPIGVKLLSSVLVACTIAAGTRAAPELFSTDWSLAAALTLVAALGILLLCLWWIWHSRVSIDGERIRQTWVWSKDLAWDDVVQARVVAIPMLEWLVAPRLIVRARGGLVQVFHVADPRVLQALAVRMALPGAR